MKATLNPCYITVRITNDYIILAHTSAKYIIVQNADMVLGDFEAELASIGVNETPVFYYDDLCVLMEKTPENAKALIDRLQEYYVEKIKLIASKVSKITANDAKMIVALTMHIGLSKDKLMRVVNGIAEEE